MPEASITRVSALNGAAWLAIDQGDYAHAASLLADSIGLSRALGNTVGEGIATVYLGRCTMSSGRIAEGAPHVERAVALVNKAGDRPAIAFTTFYSALVALLTGRLEAACDLFDRCGALAAELGLAPLSARARLMLGYPLLDLGELSAARTALAEGFHMSTDVGDRWFVQLGLGGFVGLAVKTRRPRLALRLAGAAEAYRDANEFSMPGPMEQIVDRWLVPTRARAGQAAGRLLAEGRKLTPEQAVRLVLANEPDDAPPPGSRHTLTRRETEVTALAARGLTNRDIAAQLFVSIRTVEVHVNHVLTKLGFRTRTQLAAWAHEEGLLREDTLSTYVVLQMARSLGRPTVDRMNGTALTRPAACAPTTATGRRASSGSRPDCQVLVGRRRPYRARARRGTAGPRDPHPHHRQGRRDDAAGRAIGVHARTLEVLDMMGLTDRFTERGQVVRHLRFYSQGRCLTSLEFARCGSRFGFLLDLPQDQTERLLRARITELGGVVEYGTELTGLTSGPDAVTAAIRGCAGQAQTITAGYVVGCDGAHSRVRHELGLTFHGHPYPQDWLLADVLLDWDLREDAAHAFFRPDGLPVICFPMRGHRWRLTLPFAGNRDRQAPPWPRSSS